MCAQCEGFLQLWELPGGFLPESLLDAPLEDSLEALDLGNSLGVLPEDPLDAPLEDFLGVLDTLYSSFNFFCSCHILFKACFEISYRFL